MGTHLRPPPHTRASTFGGSEDESALRVRRSLQISEELLLNADDRLELCNLCREASVVRSEMADGGGHVRELILQSSVLGRQATDGGHKTGEGLHLLLELSQLGSEDVHRVREKRARSSGRESEVNWRASSHPSSSFPPPSLHLRPSHHAQSSSTKSQTQS